MTQKSDADRRIAKSPARQNKLAGMTSTEVNGFLGLKMKQGINPLSEFKSGFLQNQTGTRAGGGARGRRYRREALGSQYRQNRGWE